MITIENDDLEGDAWLSAHRDRVDQFYAKGLDFRLVADCSTCDIHNDYICFEHELEQLRESEK